MSEPATSRIRKRMKRDDLTAQREQSRMLPSPNPATNLLIIDIIVRGASRIVRKDIEKRVARASMDKERAREVVDSRGLVKTLGLYGASKLATRSPGGLGIVVAGLAVKTLYDRGKARQLRLAREEPTPADRALPPAGDHAP
jgi:hypothetical protein